MISLPVTHSGSSGWKLSGRLGEQFSGKLSGTLDGRLSCELCKGHGRGLNVIFRKVLERKLSGILTEDLTGDLVEDFV